MQAVSTALPIESVSGRASAEAPLQELGAAQQFPRPSNGQRLRRIGNLARLLDELSKATIEREMDCILYVL
jgi:hypothetical protein